ncbi:LysR family transcriptional regulator [Bradyrhizobium jicamae]|uniref:LysR family transcriptional regulator n=1 Tax=Bradyrhizobium jicamae TaxID=280332 RepID=A0ABS5FMB5_9BRAD|nr:LysR substrate-binding domain-containing protein [Bradyrhizobium jicamae]MBR0797944.1 LysR family transcriptional regulator [Bradyrhizobium jicamae]MBR0931958.1 LysR family transcriptional regulator [Bradyrhizobium jicamae]
MSNINLKLLHTFLLAAEHESFRKAAEESNRSPSAVSMQVRDLEEQIGVLLFRRTPQKVMLTPEGRILFEQAKRALQEVQSGLDLLTESAQSRSRHIRMACVPTLASGWLPNILAMFKVRYPRSQVQLMEISTAPMLELLKRQDVEFGIGPQLPSMEDFEFEPILDDPLYACVPPAFDGGQSSIGFADLVDKPAILLSKSTAVRGLIDETLETLAIRLDVQFEVQAATTAVALAASGLGVAIVPRVALVQAGAQQFRVIPISDHVRVRQIGLITGRGQIRRPNTEQLIALIRSSLAQLG